MLVLLRVTRRWNQTGQKWAGEPDIARTFLTNHTDWLWLLVFITYAAINLRGVRCASRNTDRLGLMLSAALASLASLCFKLGFTHADAPELSPSINFLFLSLEKVVTLVTQARIVFFLLVASVAFVLFRHSAVNRKGARRLGTASIAWLLGNFDADLRSDPLEAIFNLLTLFLVTQSRINNVPLIAMFLLQLEVLRDMQLDPAEIALTSIIMEHVSFFAFGGTNAISSIDLSNAYNGVAGYDVLGVGILTFVSNWIGPIWWGAASALQLSRTRGDKSKGLHAYLIIQTFFTTCSLLFVMIACMVLRTHLFIWSVFSPKYLYTMAWTLAQHLFINVTIVSALSNSFT